MQTSVKTGTTLNDVSLINLTLRKVQAMELAKNREETKFAILLVSRTQLASVQHDTNDNSGINTHVGRMTKKYQHTITLSEPERHTVNQGKMVHNEPRRDGT